MNSIKSTRTLLTGLYFSVVSICSSATDIHIDLNTQKFINSHSELDRTRYFNIHMSPSVNAWTKKELDVLLDLNVGFGRQFWGPFAERKPPYPNSTQSKSLGARKFSYDSKSIYYDVLSHRNVVTSHPKDSFTPGMDTAAAAKWAADYFKYYWDDKNRPEYYEPMNEPFVKADEFGIDQKEAMRQMTNLFRDIGKEFDKQGINTKVIGYSSAWPSMEKWDFGHFRSRMKPFMDSAGPYMDAFAVHLYDGINVTGADNQRSGSNTDAILDLIETYSFVKWNKVKPHAITEYGGIESEEVFGKNYSDIKSAQSVRSINHMLFQLMDRQDRLLTSIPFITGKSPWHYEDPKEKWEPYEATIRNPDKNSIKDGKPTRFYWTPRLYFYKLWSDVKGKRVKAYSDNIDVQVQAFVSGKKAYIALNNLSEDYQHVSLSFANAMGNISSINKKSLKIFKNLKPVYLSQKNLGSMNNLGLESGETVVLEYNFRYEINLNERLDVKSYYSKDHLKPILANKTIWFNINHIPVPKQQGKSYLKISFSRAHEKSKSPKVLINSNSYKLPSNWKGGDQASRDEFFGTVVVPVNNAHLKKNNAVGIVFPDAGGRVSSVVLEVHNESSPDSSETVRIIGTPTTLDSSKNHSFEVKYTAERRREIILELWGATGFIGSGKRIVEAGSGKTSVKLELNSVPVSRKGYYIKTSIRPIGSSWKHNLNTNTYRDIRVASIPKRKTSIVISDGGKCVNLTGNQSNNGSAFDQQRCDSGNSRQVFLLQEKAQGWYHIRATASNKCLDIKEGSSKNGAMIQQYSCEDTNPNQLWQLVDNGNGWYQIKSKKTGKCIDRNGFKHDNGKSIQQWSCTGGSNQKFKFVTR
ncbi:RICIN domain-containing protein [Agarilytica rhodophyticola]|uniref:RICIN domain-containing protein n=1 Tax=Agarilytica rhodophyticola TaxID=1737490 RepID=UPI000CD939C4|nr:RICIN domain-containing protein [Agarilytica rhodophyticola]